MSNRVSVFVWAHDPVLEAGIKAQLRNRIDLQVLENGDASSAEAAVVGTDDVDGPTIQSIRALQRDHHLPVVLVATDLDELAMISAIEAGIAGLLRRGEVTADKLANSLKAAAAGEGAIPPDLLGSLLRRVGDVQREVLGPRGLDLNVLSPREVEVLKLVAEGMSTAEISDRLAYSERTIKNVIQGVTTRLNLRNRSHAVAFALKAGFI